MELGAFSVSLSVKDLVVSQRFYEALGFEQVSGVAEEGWVVLRNGTTVIGLFQDMFKGNMLTFNPGWLRGGEALDTFTDIREIQAQLRAEGIEPEERLDEGDIGPAYMTLVDPDGNKIFIDQHVPAPSRD
ncbi:glyoxalase [Antarctobacter heliothermus]|uniref:Glyoxalase n=1 Tax=Antarctobacter heliothermus TaxID=74033 RepID=A0A222E9R2_9RHOB|nr:VOC family protein [Antarctobacter heliothermus]ASP22955.1 glyoxalase [Antarctobacter heliothermus]